MATEYKKISGVAKWARLKSPNKFGKYSIDLYVDSTTRSQIRGWGTRLTVKEDDDGFYYTFRRDHEKVLRTKTVEFGPPEVIYNKQEFDGFVGNGSHVTIEIEVYDWEHPEHGKGRGTRLLKVTVDELVEYDPNKVEETEEVSEATPPPKATKGKKGSLELPF
jgi:hypothetical protein